MDRQTLAALLEAPLPQNLEAERSVLGSILADNNVLYLVTEILKQRDFFEPAHGEIFILLKDQIDRGVGVTAITAMHDMSQDRDIGGVTAAEYLRILEGSALPLADAVVSAATTVADLGLRRRIRSALEETLVEVQSAPASTPAATIRTKFDVTMSALFSSVSELGIRHIAEVGEEVIDEMAEAFKHEGPVGLSLPLAMVQDLTGPLLPGKLYVLGGASGSGKSALAQQIGEHVAKTGPVLFIEIEMEDSEVAQRALTARTGILAKAITEGGGQDRDVGLLLDANRELRATEFYIDASTAPTANMIRAKAVRMKRLKGLVLLVVDHLQYMEKPDPRMSDVEAIGPNLRSLKRLAKDLKIPVLCLAQLKSQFSSGEVRRPKIEDLFNPAAVEQNADVVYFVHRPEYMLRRAEPDKTAGDKGAKEHAEWASRLLQWEGKAEVIVGKRRSGEGFGYRSLSFDAPRTLFVDNRTRRNDPPPDQAGFDAF